MARSHDHAAQLVWLDLTHEQLRRGVEPLHLRPKSFAVLRYLVAHPGQVVTKDELVQAIWPETAVSDGVLAVSITEIRQALGETPQAPQYLETVPRRGYRWLGQLPTANPIPAAPPRPTPPVPSPLLVGREAAGAQLHAWLEQAQSGRRQVGFVTGEAGLGKTAVVDAFVAQVACDPGLWVARGQCVEHYGASEAYLPVLEALGQLCRGPDGAQLVAELTQHAPTWLVQLPALLSEAALAAVQRRVLGATRERMLRELAEAVEALTAERTLVLVLEDLHWSDAATLDLMASLARRRAPARLLVLGTYRPVEVIVHKHPLHALKLDLTLHQQCADLPLQLLTAADVAQYLAGRFGAQACPAALAQALYRRTDGHPLFLVTVVDALVRQGVLREEAGRWEVAGELAAVEAMVPETLREMIAQQFNALSPVAQGVLAAAGVAGMENTVAAVAAGVEMADEAVEAQCADLAQQGLFLQTHGVEDWPDGTVTARYCFRHTLYQQVVYEGVPVGRRLQLHRQIGVRLEAGYGEQAGERAAALAMHFDRGRMPARAVPYWRQAAANALRRWAYAEAIGPLRRGLEGLQTLPDTRERAQQELDMQLALGQALTATHGPAATVVGHAYARAEELCRQVGEGPDGPAPTQSRQTPQRVAVLRGLRRFYLARGESAATQACAEQFLSLAQQAHDTALLMEAHIALGISTLYQGDVTTAHTSLERGLALYDPQRHRAHALHAGQDFRVTGLTHAALALWVLGFTDQALERVHTVLELAHSLSSPHSLAVALDFAAVVHLLCGNWQAVQHLAGDVVRLATEQEFAFWLGQGLMLQGWAMAKQGQTAEGLAQMQQARTVYQAAEQQQGQQFLLALLSEQHGQAGQTTEGLQVLAEAMTVVHSRGLHVWEAELHRLRGELLLQQAAGQGSAGTAATATEAEACLQQALAVARRQGAKALELRAAIGLSRLWARQGKREAARQFLAEVYGWFTEGFDTADLQEAKALLEAYARDRCSTGLPA